MMSLPIMPVRNSLCEEFREISGNILGSARFILELQKVMCFHDKNVNGVPYLMRLGFVDILLSLLRRFKEDEESREIVLSSIRHETWVYLTSSFLLNSHGNIYHCRYLELLLVVLECEFEESLCVLFGEKCKILDLFLETYQNAASKADCKGHILTFFRVLSEKSFGKGDWCFEFLSKHEAWNAFLRGKLENEIRLNSVDDGEDGEDDGSVVENDNDDDDDLGGALD